MNYKHFACLIFCLLLCFVSQAQTPPGEGEGNPNPQSPSNWEILPSVYEGEDNYTRQEYELINNVWTEVSADYTRDWSDNIWYRNGVSQGSVDYSIPFHSGVHGYAVHGQSEGSIKVRMQWKNTAVAAPAQVRIIVSSSANAQCTVLGAVSVDNGIGTMVAVETDGDTTHKSASGTKAFVVAVQGGIAEYEVETSAMANGVPPNGYTLASCSANARGASIAVDTRQAIIMQAGVGGHYDREIGAAVAQTLSFNQLNPAYTWSRALNIVQEPSDLWQTVNYSYSYPGATQKLAKLNYGSPVSNTATWHFGFPLAIQTYTATPQYTGYDPIEVLPFNITLIGNASSDGKPTESFTFQGLGANLSGTLPSSEGNYIIEDLVSQDYAQDLQYAHLERFNLNDPIALTKAWTKYTSSASTYPKGTVTLTYTHSDGMVSTSQRTYVFKPSIEEVRQTEHAKVDWRIGHGWKTIAFQGGLTELSTTQQGEFDAEGGYGVDYYGLAGTVGGVMEVSGIFAVVSGPYGLAAAAGATLGVIFQMVSDTAPIPSTMSHSHECPARYFYDNGYHHTMKGGTAIGDYKWSAQWRARKQITPTYIDHWNAAGFSQRTANRHVGMEKATSAPPRVAYRYTGGDYPNDPPGGGGGPIGGGTG